MENFTFKNGYTAKREYGSVFYYGKTISFDGRWVLRDENGWYIGCDYYSNDLFERHNVKNIQNFG